MKIAIVGAGISGLGAAFRLSEYHDITLFEARARLGGHSRTFMVGPNKNIAVDTGFMVFNDRNYPELNKLFGQLNLTVQKSNMSFGVSMNDGQFEYGLHEFRRLLADPKNALRPKFWRMIKDILKFNKAARSFIHNPKTTLDPNLTLGEYLNSLDMSPYFIERYLCPLAGAIWSTSTQDMLRFPAQTLIQFFNNHGLLSKTDSPQWYTLEGGAQTYVRQLETILKARGCKILCSTPITQVLRTNGLIKIKSAQNEFGDFDAIIFANHANQALASLQTPSKEERNILGALRTRKNIVVLHNDPSQMPRRRKCWSSWVYKGAVNAQEQNSFTYWMNSLQSIPEDYPVFVTLNPKQEIQEKYIFDSTVLAHPQFDLAAIQAQNELPSIQGQNNTWYCGAYTRYGFHEDGLVSGLAAADMILGLHAQTHHG